MKDNHVRLASFETNERPISRSREHSLTNERPVSYEAGTIRETLGAAFFSQKCSISFSQVQHFFMSSGVDDQ